MTEALSIFLNGIAGVVLGMGTLYLAIKLLALIGHGSAGEKPED